MVTTFILDCIDYWWYSFSVLLKFFEVTKVFETLRVHGAAPFACQQINGVNSKQHDFTYARSEGTND